MKRILLTLGIASLALMSTAQAKDNSTYITASYGLAKSSSDSSVLTDISGQALGLGVGFKLSMALGWEFLGRSFSYDTASSSIDLSALGGGTYTLAADPSALFIGTGLRWFLFRYINIHFGLGYSKADLKASVTGSGTTITAPSDASGLGFYFGGGLQIPIGQFEIGGDYTLTTLSSDFGSKDIVFNLRYYF